VHLRLLSNQDEPADAAFWRIGRATAHSAPAFRAKQRALGIIMDRDDCDVMEYYSAGEAPEVGTFPSLIPWAL
jgi:hypothetical protein